VLKKEGKMTEITKADMIYTDEQGQEWINSEAVADLWNKRAKEEYTKQGRYTRWSARNRVETSGDLRTVKTVKGTLYNKKDTETVKLSPRQVARPDIVQRNKERGFENKKPISEQSEN